MNQGAKSDSEALRTALESQSPMKAANIAALTDNSGAAAADGTIAAITLTAPADLAAQTVINAQLAAQGKENTAKINALLAALKTGGLMVADA